MLGRITTWAKDAVEALRAQVSSVQDTGASAVIAVATRQRASLV
jgi:hypothetical protein